MENRSQYPKYDFLNAKAIMEELYDIRISEDSFIEKAYYAWKELPDKHTDYHVYIDTVNMHNKLMLPENVEYIMNVNYANTFFDNIYGLGTETRFFIYKNGSKITTLGSKEWESYRIDKSISDRFSDNITYTNGDGYIEFEQGDLNGTEIAVLYKGLIVNKDCDPMLYYREVSAIAARVAYYQCRIDVRNLVPGAAQLVQMYLQESNKAVLRAGIPEQITDNEIDRVLNAMVSMDRKVYNKNYKFRS